MKLYTIDLDIFKEIKKCKKAHDIMFRISANKGGLHIRWYCDKKRCKLCSSVKKKYDDSFRLYADLTNRKTYQRNVLFTYKGKNKSSKWIKVD